MANYERATEKEIETALSFIPCDDRETWYKMAFAIRDELGDDGFDMWDKWSENSDSYNVADAKDVWKSASGKGITIATLFKMARDFGYRSSGEEISDEEYQARRAKREADAIKREAEEAQKRAMAAKRSREIWASAAEFTDGSQHPYTARKSIDKPLAQVRIGPWTKKTQSGDLITIENCILLPIRTTTSKDPVSLQAYFPEFCVPLNRDRDFIYGGEKSGCFMPIGKLSKSYKGTIVIEEGWATGEKIAAATGHLVIVAFDAGNIPTVAREIRKLYPDNEIVIAADDDRYHDSIKKKNAGLVNAVKAAKEINASVAVPEFQDRSKKPTDFDDMAAESGLSAVAAAINNPLRPHQVDTKTDIQRSAVSESALVLASESGFDLSTVDWYSEFPDVNGKGKPLDTIENLIEALRRLRITVRYNVISKDIETIIPNEGFSIDNSANASFAFLMSACVRFGLPTGKLMDYMTRVADMNQYNPAANWITSRPWDGVERLADFIQTIKAKGESGSADCPVMRLKVAMLTRWMISACAAAFNPEGVSAAGVLVLQGDQYLGKTKWFKSLVPHDLKLTQDGLSLRPDDRDSVKQAVSFWLVELGELDATFRKSDISALKAFITRDRDVMRRAYARNESQYARRTVFFASVNPENFLHDSTGNRRYWTISCSEIDHTHGLDMQQVWAEVYSRFYQQGESWYLSTEEMALLNNHNEDFEVLDPISERLLDRLNWEEKEQFWTWKSATQIMADIGFDRPTKADVTACGAKMVKLNQGKKKKSNGNRVLLTPPVKKYND